MIKIKAHELAPENIGYPVKLISQYDHRIMYHMLTGFEPKPDGVQIYCGNANWFVDNDYYITVYDKDI